MVILSKHSTFTLPNKLLALLNEYEFIFNPSYSECNGGRYLAIRLCKNKKSLVISKVFYWEDSSINDIFDLDLSSFFKNKINLSKVADPKLFILNKKLHCTFNTGQPKGRDNKVFICVLNKVSVESYFECIYDQRVRVEKNWSFFYKKNKLHCLYSIYPLTILKVDQYDKNKIHFIEDKKIEQPITKGYTIGTPLLKVENVYYLIAHKKVFFKGKRLYYGCLFKLDLNNKVCMTKEKHILFHSIKSLFGDKFKFNKRLISCTYFSGLYMKEDKFIVSYGVNDIDWNLVELNKQTLIK